VFNSRTIWRACTTAALAVSCAPAGAAGQTPAAPPADDAPSIKVGVQLFADYTLTQQPKSRDADGNTVTLNQFEIGRSYINVFGNISKTIAFRVTPDIVRETGVGSSLNGSYVFRLKYAYAQWNLDNHLGTGSWVRFGQQPTPWVGFVDDVYRYRFQGQTFEEREGYLSSTDAGATFHYDLPGDYGDLHAGVYNGEGWQHVEVNDQKGWMIRGTARPLGPHAGVLHGLRVSGFFDHDTFVKDADRQRAVVAVTFQHTYLNAAFDYLAAKDQPSANATATNARGWSAWVTPRTTLGWEGLLRLDRLEPDTARPSQKKTRTIAGVAYWFPHQGGVSTALLVDVDNLTFDGFPAASTSVTQRRIALHALLNF
jgi:hypothetical protein